MIADPLIALRGIADPLADAACACLPRLKQATPAPLLEQVVRSAHRQTDCRAFVEFADEVPAWVDPEQLQRGAELFLRDFRVGLARILLGTLPLSYSSPSGAHVLVATGKLIHAARRRLYETAGFVLELMRSRGCLPNSSGHRAVLEVRLRHALVRRMLREGGHWNEVTHGPPIHQLDTAFIGSAFSQIVLDGLQMLSPVSEDDANAYQHLWRYANWLIGVPEIALATSAAEEATLLRRLRLLQSHPTEQSRQLTQALHRAFAWRAPFKGMPPALLQGITRVMVGAETADALGLPQRRWLRKILRLLRARELARRQRGERLRPDPERAVIEMEEILRSGLHSA